MLSIVAFLDIMMSKMARCDTRREITPTTPRGLNQEEEYTPRRVTTITSLAAITNRIYNVGNRLLFHEDL